MCCIICFTVYSINTDNTSNNTIVNNTTNNNNTNSTITDTNNSNNESSSVSTGSDNQKSDSSESDDDWIDRSYGDGRYYDIPVGGTSGEKTVKGKCIGRDKYTGCNVYKLENGKTVSGDTYWP